MLLQTTLAADMLKLAAFRTVLVGKTEPLDIVNIEVAHCQHCECVLRENVQLSLEPPDRTNLPAFWRPVPNTKYHWTEIAMNYVPGTLVYQ